MDDKIISYGDIHFPQIGSKLQNFQNIIYDSSSIFISSIRELFHQLSRKIPQTFEYPTPLDSRTF